MKKYKYLVFIFVSAILTYSSCDIPSYTTDTYVAAGSTNLVQHNEYQPLVIPAVDVSLSSSFMRGVDASEVKALEENGIIFYDEANHAQDAFSILAENGVNWIRLRLWNDYTQSLEDQWGPYGYNNITRTIDMAKRAKKYGMKILLDFHYSDNWADPAKQKTPAMWATITNTDDMALAVSTWTKTILQQMKNEGCAPDMVQLGNEMEGGLFSTGGAFIPTHAQNATILNATATKVRAVLPDCKIMLHMSRGGNGSVLNSFYSNYISKVDCDVVGLSYYPFYTSHGSIENLKTNIQKIVNTYEKEAVIVETSFGYSTTVWTDSTDNEFFVDEEKIAASLLPSYSNIVTDSSNTKLIKASITNQAGVVRDIIENSAQAGGSGVFYWGACYLGIDGVMPSSWENQALFDIHGKVLPSIAVMKVASK